MERVRVIPDICIHPPDSSLTVKGRQQAEFIAARVSKLPIKIVISSTMPRAHETANAILQKVPTPIEYSDLFQEVKRPSVQIGLERNSDEGLRIERERYKNFAVPGWRHSDEENFEDLRERARMCLEVLAQKEENEILVVTHGLFIRYLLAIAVFGPEVTPEVTEHIVRSFHMENTGLSVFGYDETKKHPWWLWVWNDHAHLG